MDDVSSIEVHRVRTYLSAKDIPDMRQNTNKYALRDFEPGSHESHIRIHSDRSRTHDDDIGSDTSVHLR